MRSKDFLKKNFRWSGFLLGLIATVVLMNIGGLKSALYQASVLDLPTHAPFDGTVYPVSLVPDYTKLSEAERGYSFKDLPKSKLVSIPKYESAVLRIGADSLEWGKASDNAIRNAKITYSVPYMGSYKLNGLENDGSHLAVDIKIPMRTPLLAIANGTVTKVSNKTSGFGKHVVLMHKDVPDPRGSKRLVTLYSSYSHNDENLVAVGDVVKKGDVIAYSGNTGTSTTPHVHFQLDNEKAPWHPYWPFTWQEANDAGLSFFEAVNAGLGKEKALEASEHPMVFVQDNLDGDFEVKDYVVPIKMVEREEEEVLSPSASSVVKTENENNVKDERSNEVEAQEEEKPVEIVEKDPAVFDSFEIVVEDNYFTDEIGRFQVQVLDQYGELFWDGFEGEVVVKSVGGSASANSAILTNRNFEKGVNQNSFRRLSANGKERMQIEYKGEKYRSDAFEIIDPNAESEVEVRVASDNGSELVEVAEASAIFRDVPVGHKYYDAFKFMYEEGIITGYSDGTAKPDKVVSRVEAAKIIVEALEIDVEKLGQVTSLPFPDASADQWYGKYVKELYDRGILTGTDQGLLLPSKDVNGAELMKMLLVAMEVELSEKETSPWYQKYVIKARNLGVVDGGFMPSKGMTRGEVAEAMYRLLGSE